MKPIISEIDYKLLHDLLTSQRNGAGKNLSQEITKAVIIKEAEMDKKTIRINSQVEFEDLVHNKKIKLKIVLPDYVDLRNRVISILAPLSAALIGYKENDIIPWTTPVGETSYRITKVLNE